MKSFAKIISWKDSSRALSSESTFERGDSIFSCWIFRWSSGAQRWAPHDHICLEQTLKMISNHFHLIRSVQTFISSKNTFRQSAATRSRIIGQLKMVSNQSRMMCLSLSWLHLVYTTRYHGLLRQKEKWFLRWMTGEFLQGMITGNHRQSFWSGTVVFEMTHPSSSTRSKPLVDVVFTSSPWDTSMKSNKSSFLVNPWSRI